MSNDTTIFVCSTLFSHFLWLQTETKCCSLAVVLYDSFIVWQGNVQLDIQGDMFQFVSKEKRGRERERKRPINLDNISPELWVNRMEVEHHIWCDFYREYLWYLLPRHFFSPLSWLHFSLIFSKERIILRTLRARSIFTIFCSFFRSFNFYSASSPSPYLSLKKSKSWITVIHPKVGFFFIAWSLKTQIYGHRSNKRHDMTHVYMWS